MSRLGLLIFSLFLLAACGPRELEPDAAFECSNCERWNMPQEPFRILGNTWFVGTAGLTALLIETDDGLILIDGALPQSAALIDSNIRKLGFDPLNIKAILLSHAHFDHAGGLNALGDHHCPTLPARSPARQGARTRSDTFAYSE